MKRLALSISIAALALGLGACEQRSSADLPEHYQHKGSHGSAPKGGHEAAPPHGGGEKAPAADHKG